MLCLQKDFYKNIHSSFIHGSPELERMQMPFCGGMESCGVPGQWTMTKQYKRVNHPPKQQG